MLRERRSLVRGFRGFLRLRDGFARLLFGLLIRCLLIAGNLCRLFRCRLGLFGLRCGLVCFLGRERCLVGDPLGRLRGLFRIRGSRDLLCRFNGLPRLLGRVFCGFRSLVGECFGTVVFCGVSLFLGIFRCFVGRLCRLLCFLRRLGNDLCRRLRRGLRIFGLRFDLTRDSRFLFRRLV